MRVSLAFMAWDKLTRSWQGCGGMMAVMFQKTPQQPSQMKVFRTKKCNAILVVTGILVMGISNIYIYTNNIHPICHKAARNGVGICESEGRQTSRFQKSNFPCIFEPQGFTRSKIHETAVSGFHPCWCFIDGERNSMNDFLVIHTFPLKYPWGEVKKSQNMCFFPKIRHSSGVLLTELKTDVINGGIRLIPLFADSMVVPIYGNLGHCKSTQ